MCTLWAALAAACTFGMMICEDLLPAGDELQPAAARPAASTAAKAAPRNDLDAITASRMAGAELRAHAAAWQGIAK